MREYKYRAWDKEYEKMTYFDDEDYDYRPPLVFRLDQVFKKDSNYDDYEDFEYNDITDSVELMQFTGLHDKNGKEIYEGDIVKSFFVDTDEAGNEIYKYYIIEVKYDEVLCSYKIDKFMNLEVIGNIYENKELLNETNR